MVHAAASEVCIEQCHGTSTYRHMAPPARLKFEKKITMCLEIYN